MFVRSFLASANFYVPMDGMEGCELDDVVVDVSDAPDELEALNDDLLRRILAFAGPTAALRQSSRLLHWLGNDDTLWQEWCERVDAENAFVGRAGNLNLDVVKRARMDRVVCHKVRLRHQ